MANHRTRAIPEPSADEHEEPERWMRRPKTTRRRWPCARGRADYRAGRRESDVAAAERLGTTRVIVGKRRQRFVASGCDGLPDESRSGAPRRIGDGDVERVVAMTLESMPRDATRWSTRSMARAGGPGPATVEGRIRRAFGLKPHRVGTFKPSRDPPFVGKVRDIAGPYPPAGTRRGAVRGREVADPGVDRTQPIPPMRPGTPERHTQDYGRHGTTSPFAALNTAVGEVSGGMPSPAPCGRVPPRYPPSMAQPEKAITDHLEIHNQYLKPFGWTKSTDDILNAVKSYYSTIYEAKD